MNELVPVLAATLEGPAAWTVPVIVLALAALVAWVSPRAAYGAGLASTLASLAWILLVPDGVLVEASFLGFEIAPVFVDGLTRVLGVVFAGIGAAGILYAWSVGSDHRLIAFALAYVASSFGAVLAGDWLSLIVWWEVMAVTSTLLVWHHGGPAVRAGFRYAVLHGIGGSLLLIAVILHAVEAGSLLYDGGLVSGPATVLGALGIGVNVGFVGLHAWLPDTYPSPHIAASVFLCVYTTKTGVYGLLRAFPEGHVYLAYMGAAMALFGVVLALVQDDMRRFLSYSIQSQVGYMVAGVGLGTALSQSGALAHVFNHIVYKALLFMVAGVVILRTGRERFSSLGGLWRAMPYTAGAFAVAALSIAGFPGFSGYVSKGMVTDAAHHGPDLVYWGLLVAAVGTFLALTRFGYEAFIKKPPEDLDAGGVEEAPSLSVGVMLATAFVCVLVGVVPSLLFGLVEASPTTVFEGIPEVHPYSLGHVEKGLITAVIALAVFAIVRRPLTRARGIPDVDAVYNPLVFHGMRALLTVLGGIRRGVDAGYGALTRRSRALLESPVVGEEAPIGVGVFFVTLVLGAALVVAIL